VADPTADVEVKEDDFDPDAEPVPTTCKAGDIWQLGNHRLMCGDSTKAEDVAKLMNGEQADLWLTDPPYNVALGYDVESEEEAKARHRRTDGLTVKNDSMSREDFIKFLTSAFASAKPMLKPGAAYYIWYAATEHYSFEQALINSGLALRQVLIWNKNVFSLRGKITSGSTNLASMVGTKEQLTTLCISSTCQPFMRTATNSTLIR
jgi:site-specific DNA-methyltransferase (adenine-specific)